MEYGRVVSSRVLAIVAVLVTFTTVCAGRRSTSLDTSRIYKRKVETTCPTLDGKLTDLTTKVDKLTEKLDGLVHNLNTQKRPRCVVDFDDSGYFCGKMYRVSKGLMLPFDIARANNLCREAGGYLVEIDTMQEFNFVRNFVKEIGGTDTFWTGANDLTSEGHFKFYNSKKAVPNQVWADEQPDDHDTEDCVEIRLLGGGLNDLSCSDKGKFICEVPVVSS